MTTPWPLDAPSANSGCMLPVRGSRARCVVIREETFSCRQYNKRQDIRSVVSNWFVCWFMNCDFTATDTLAKFCAYNELISFGSIRMLLCCRVNQVSLSGLGGFFLVSVIVILFDKCRNRLRIKDTAPIRYMLAHLHLSSVCVARELIPATYDRCHRYDSLGHLMPHQK